MKKRILSIMLVFCMMLTLLPGNSFAEGTEVASVTTSEGVVTPYPDFITAFNAANASSGSTLTLLNDTSAVYSDEMGSAYLSITCSNMTLDLNGHTLTLSGYTFNTLNISGNVVFNDSSSAGTGMITGNDVIISHANGNLTINGGSFIGTANASGTSTVSVEVIDNGNITINGGSFKSLSDALKISTNGTVILKGGTYYPSGFGNAIVLENGKYAAELLAENYCYYNEDGTVYTPATDATSIGQTVRVDEKPKVASVTTIDDTTTEYYDFISAFNAANENSGSTLKLLNNVRAVTDVVGGMSYLNINNITLDLNGYTLDFEQYTFRTNSDSAHLTINDSSTVGTGKITSTTSIVHNMGGKLTINGGSFETTGTAQTIYVYRASGNTIADVVIKGGSFISQGNHAFNLEVGTATLYGGKYSGKDFSFMGIVHGILADGYCFYDAAGKVFTPAANLPFIQGTVTVGEKQNVASVTPSGGTPTEYADFVAAFNAANANSGSTLKLLNNAISVSSTEEYLTVNNNMTIDLNDCTLTLDKYSFINGSDSSDLTITDSSDEGTGEIISTGTADSGSGFLFTWFGGNLTINKGSFTTNYHYVVYALNMGTTVTINGGTFEAYQNSITVGVDTDVKLYGGRYNGISISGYNATVNDLLPENYCYYDTNGDLFTPATNAAWIDKNKPVTVGEKKVASVTNSAGETQTYTDFITAFNAAKASSGSTLKLLIDASAVYDGLYSNLDINNKMTLDLNGYTLTLDKYILRTNAETADFTINDSSEAGTGKITSTNELIYNMGGKLTINGGSFEASSIAINVDNPTAVTIINGGFFSGKPTFIRGNGRVALYGGTYNSSIFSVRVDDGTVNDLLPEGYCYYDTAGNVFIPAADATYIEQTVSIGEIDWSKAVTYDDSAKTYTLYSAGGLRWISGISNGTVTADTYKNDPVMPADKSFAGYTVKLAADIDLSGKNWMPINEFHGTFDGVGHKITNMTINDSYASAAHIGFINQLYGKVKNLYVEGSVTVTSNNVYAGGIAGYMEFDSGIYNCVSDINVSVTATSSFAGGIAGKALQAEILNCIYTGTEAASGASSYSGALVGNADGTTISNCYAKNTVTINKDGCINLPIISSIGSFDENGNLTAAKGCVFDTTPPSDCTLEYGTTLKQAMKNWVLRQGINAASYVTWTTDAIPTLTTNYSEPHIHSFVWEQQADGSYKSICSECGEQVTAEACITSGSTVSPYATLEEAITAAQSASGSTVKLLDNLTTEKTVQVSSGTFTIDMNGKTWTADLPEGSNALFLDGTSNVTLKDSGTNGKFTSNAVDTEHGYKSTVYAQSAFTIESGIYDNTNNNPSLYVNGVQSNINITGGIFKGNVTFENCENIMLSGGTYDYICTENNGDESKIGTIGELLANGYGYRYTAGSSHANEWATVTDTSDIDNITVQKVPVKITAQTLDTVITYGNSTTLSVTAQKAEGVDVGKEITYKWYKYNGTEYILIEAAIDASYSLPNDLAAGSYRYYCEVSCDGYTVKSEIITVTVNKIAGSIANKNYATSYIFNRNAITVPTADNFTLNVPSASIVFTWYKGNSTDAADKLSDIPSQAGTYTLKVTSEGNSNIAAAECTVPVEVKYLETDVVATKSPDKEWYNADDFKSDIKLNPESNYWIYIDDPYGGSSVDELIVNEYIKENNVIVEGQREVKYQLYPYDDMNAGLTDFKSIIFNVDVTAPTMGTPTYSQHHSFLGWLFHNSKIDVTVPVSDAVSGADHIRYVITPDGGTAQEPKTANVGTDGNATFTVEKNFKGAIAITAYDKAGNASDIVDINKMFIEDTKPTLTVNDGTNEFTDSWYTTAQTLHVSAADEDSGIKSITYTVDGSSATTLFEAKNTDSSLTEAKDGLTIAAVDGEHTYTVTVTDNALNTITTTVTVKQDTVVPTLSNPVAPTGDKLTDTTATVTFTASEAGSFCYAVQRSGDQTPTVDGLLGNEAHSMTADDNNTISLAELEQNTGYTLYFAAKDVAGNKTAQVTSVNFTTEKTSIAGATVTVNEDTFTYNGLSQKAAVTVKLGDITLTADTDYTVSYSNSNGGTDNTTNAGTVTVTVTATSNGGYSGVVTDTATYTIEKAVLTPSISGTTTKEYDGGTTVDSGMSISLSGIRNNEMVTATAAYSYDDKNVGVEKTVNAIGITLTGDNGNYKLAADTASADVGTITARKVAVNISGDSTYVYNGKAEYTHTASYSTVSGDTADVTIKYDGSTEKPADVELDKGSITAYTLVAVINDGNYELTTTTGTTQFTITQAAITAKDTGKSLHYSKTTQQTIAASDFGITLGGTFSANGNIIDTGNVLSDVPVYGDTVKYQLKNEITYNEQNPQTVTIPVTFTPTDTNYAPVNVTLTVTLTDKDTVTMALTANKTADITYGDSVTYTAELDKDHVFLDALQALDGSIKFYLGDADTGELLATENVSSSARTVSTKLTCDKLTAGNHIVTAVYSGNTDFASTQAATTTTVAKKAVTVKPKDVSITSGSTVPAFELVFTGLIGSETLDISQVPVLECKKDGNTVDGRTAGTYTVTWTNEAGSTIIDGTGKAANYDITKLATGTLTVSSPPSDGGNYSGSGTLVGALTVPVLSGLGEIKVSASVSGTIATVSVTDAQLKEITSGADNTRNVKMDLSDLKVDTVVIPSNIISAVKGASSSTGLEVVLPTGAVVLDNKALGSVENKGDIKISVEEVKSVTLTDEQKEALGTQAGTIGVVDVNVYANGIKISTFGSGKINVSVPYTLKDGEKAENITVWFMKDDGTIEPKKGSYNTKTGKVEFTTEHLSQYFIVNFPFIDVVQNAWYYGSVAYAYNNGMFSGTGDMTFSPNIAMTRGMLVTVLWCMEGKPATETGSFTDVASGAYYKDAIAWASANGIVNGYGNGKFGPDNSITREQMATILYHYAMYKKYDTTQGGMAVREFADYNNISEYALPALGWAVNSGIMNGSGNKLTPKDNATRAQVAAVLMHFRKNIVK